MRKVKQRSRSLEKEDIELFLEWMQRKDLADWTKYSYKCVLKVFSRPMGETTLPIW